MLTRLHDSLMWKVCEVNKDNIRDRLRDGVFCRHKISTSFSAFCQISCRPHNRMYAFMSTKRTTLT